MLTVMRPAYNSTSLEDGFFSDFFGPGVPVRRARTAWPAVDVDEWKNRFTLTADLPGVEEKDIRLEFSEGTLTLEASRHGEKADENEERRVHLREREVLQYKRSFTLGEGVDASKILATFKNGTLTIELPKAERSIARVIPVAGAK